MDILIVDDDPQVRTVHQRVLERAGYMVTTVENGLQAFAALQEQEFSAILCDLQMPFLKGQGFYEELRREYPDLVPRLIFVTGWGRESEAREFLESTGRPVLHKPVEFKDLIAAVQRVVVGPASE